MSKTVAEAAQQLLAATQAELQASGAAREQADANAKAAQAETSAMAAELRSVRAQLSAAQRAAEKAERAAQKADKGAAKERGLAERSQRQLAETKAAAWAEAKATAWAEKAELQRQQAQQQAEAQQAADQAAARIDELQHQTEELQRRLEAAEAVSAAAAAEAADAWAALERRRAEQVKSSALLQAAVQQSQQARLSSVPALLYQALGCALHASSGHCSHDLSKQAVSGVRSEEQQGKLSAPLLQSKCDVKHHDMCVGAGEVGRQGAAGGRKRPDAPSCAAGDARRCADARA